MPSGKDPDDAARGSPVLFKKALKAAQPIYDYFIASATARFDKHDAFGKRKISDELLPVIAKIDNPIIQGHYVKKLAAMLGVSEDAVGDGMRKLARTQAVGHKDQGSGEREGRNSRGREENLELYVLAILLQGKTIELYEDFKESIILTDFTTASIGQILEHLDRYLGDHAIFLIKDFADRLPQELTATLDEAFLWDIADLLDDQERMSKEWAKALVELKRTSLRRRMGELSLEISKGKDVSLELRELTRKLKTLDNPR